MLTDLEIVELAARRAYSVDYGMHAKNLFKIMADNIYTLQKERAEQEAKAHKEAMSHADETIGVS